MTARPSSAATLLLLTPLLAGACHDEPKPAQPDATPSSPVVVAEDAHVDAGLPPRCTLVTKGAPADIPFGEGAELGEAVPIAGGFAVGMLRAGDAGRVASVVRLDVAATPPVDLGLSGGDAPAPQPIVRASELYAVTYVRPDSKGPAAGPHAQDHAGRALVVHHLGKSLERLVQLPAETDSSAAYDVVAATDASSPIGALVAWDDSVGAPARGVIQLAALSPDLHAVRTTRVIHAAASTGTEASEAGDPRLAARASGYWLTWVARAPEHPLSTLPLPAGEIETPSEEATFGWVEAVALDADGAPTGVPQRLTSSTGHVGRYAVYAHDSALDVIAEDEGATERPGGGSLERVVWRGDGAPLSTVIVRGGVDEDAPPNVIPGAPGEAWLAFLDVKGDTELTPLLQSDGIAAHPAPKPPTPTREPLLTRGRLLGVPLGVEGGRFALATEAGARWTLHWATCTQ